MSKRQTLAEQVGTQAIELRDLNAELATIKADFRTLEAAHETQTESLEATVRLNAKLHDDYDQLKQERDKLAKDLETATSNRDYHSRQSTEKSVEIEQAHASLDAIPEALSREYEKEYGKGTRDLSSRIIGTILAVVRSGK